MVFLGENIFRGYLLRIYFKFMFLNKIMGKNFSMFDVWLWVVEIKVVKVFVGIKFYKIIIGLMFDFC